ncbi:hypothetical protein Tco_1408976 [Tanacetum coccineum]
MAMVVRGHGKDNTVVPDDDRPWEPPSIHKKVVLQVVTIAEAESRSKIEVTHPERQLEKRFSLSDGSRKYKLNKDTYEINQSGSSVVQLLIQLRNVNKKSVLFVVQMATPEKCLLRRLDIQHGIQSVQRVTTVETMKTSTDLGPGKKPGCSKNCCLCGKW